MNDIESSQQITGKAGNVECSQQANFKDGAVLPNPNFVQKIMSFIET